MPRALPGISVVTDIYAQTYPPIPPPSSDNYHASLPRIAS